MFRRTRIYASARLPKLDSQQLREYVKHMNGWIGVDLDGTWAEYHGWKGPEHIGPAIPSMTKRIQDWIAAGIEVRVFTARVSHDGTERRIHEASVAHSAITKFTIEQLGFPLTITNVKDYGMLELYDDRAVQVEENTGRLIGHSTRNYTP